MLTLPVRYSDRLTLVAVMRLRFTVRCVCVPRGAWMRCAVNNIGSEGMRVLAPELGKLRALTGLGLGGTSRDYLLGPAAAARHG